MTEGFETTPSLMPSKIKLFTRSLLTRFRPIEHIPSTLNSNVHDLARVGGVSVFTLPYDYAPCDLVIPTRFAATAQFLVDVTVDDNDARLEQRFVEETPLDGSLHPRLMTGRIGRSPDADIPGLFRIPGSKVTTDRLRAFFERHMYDGIGDVQDIRRHSQDIEYTVRLGTLPNQIVLPYQIHDVASCFKSFLGDLEGGLLGKLEIFEGLRKVCLPRRRRKSTESADLEWKCIGLSSADDDEPVDPKHVARVLCSIQCAASRNLILAVFGLLAFFMVDDLPLQQRYEQQRHSSSGIPVLDELRTNCFPPSAVSEARMTAEALGRIFAPLMLGDDLTRQINMDFAPTTHSRKLDSRRRDRTESPQKGKSPSPNKRSLRGRSTFRTSFRMNRTNITFNLNSHPLYPHADSSSKSRLDRSDSTRPCSTEAPYSQQKARPRLAESWPKLNNSEVEDTQDDSRSWPLNMHALISNSKTQKQKEKNTSGSDCELHDRQARILLIANVITVLLWNWREVCLELRAVGYGRTEGRWHVGIGEPGGV